MEPSSIDEVQSTERQVRRDILSHRELPPGSSVAIASEESFTRRGHREHPPIYLAVVLHLSGPRTDQLGRAALPVAAGNGGTWSEPGVQASERSALICIKMRPRHQIGSLVELVDLDQGFIRRRMLAFGQTASTGFEPCSPPQYSSRYQ